MPCSCSGTTWASCSILARERSDSCGRRAAAGSYQRMPLSDLVDVEEHIVWAHEELRAAASAED